jgi:tartrate-resistant acid phosphatase type 5
MRFNRFAVYRIALSLASVAFCFAARADRIAIIGDFGSDNSDELAVADRLKSYDPDYMVTVGDNNYLLGFTPGQDFADWDATNGKYYGQYIQLPAGSVYLPGATTNNYFPVLGNHDWNEGVQSYSDYFDTLPSNPSGNSRYYTFTRGDVQFFMLDADPHEDSQPDGGRAPGTTQYEWAKNAIESSTAKFQFVVFHQAAWAYDKEETAMQWPFKEWGVDAVFSGHRHNMQDMTVEADAGGNGVPYFVMGASGNGLDNTILPGAQPVGAIGNWYNQTDFGFLLVDVIGSSADVQFIDAAGDVLHERMFGPQPIPGDYNSDGRVDAMDYDVWSSTFGATAAAGGLSADGNDDGTIDAADYIIWRDHAAAESAGFSPSTTVPEPAGHCLASAAVAAFMALAYTKSKCPQTIAGWMR